MIKPTTRAYRGGSGGGLNCGKGGEFVLPACREGNIRYINYWKNTYTLSLSHACLCTCINKTMFTLHAHLHTHIHKHQAVLKSGRKCYSQKSPCLPPAASSSCLVGYKHCAVSEQCASSSHSGDVIHSALTSRTQRELV